MILGAFIWWCAQKLWFKERYRNIKFPIGITWQFNVFKETRRNIIKGTRLIFIRRFSIFSVSLPKYVNKMSLTKSPSLSKTIFPCPTIPILQTCPNFNILKLPFQWTFPPIQKSEHGSNRNFIVLIRQIYPAIHRSSFLISWWRWKCVKMSSCLRQSEQVNYRWSLFV